MNVIKKLEKENIEDILALTPLQEGMLFHYLKSPGSDLYFEQLCLQITGLVDTEIFNRAWNVVTDNNEMLRAVFRWEKLKHPTQVILKKHNFKIRFYDLSGGESSDKEKLLKLSEIKQQDRQDKFDLREFPFRVTLCRIEKTKYEMIISSHHILYDGWSNGIILKELFAGYEDLSKGKKPVKPVKNKFKEYVNWIRSQDKNKQEKFWKEYLGGCYTSTELSVKKAGGKEITAIGNLKIKPGRDLKVKLENFIRGNKITLASLLYTSWAILLQRYNSSNDVIFGTTVSGRSAKINDIENIVGLFINTLPLRVQSDANEKIEDLLKKINEALQAREEYETTPLSDIKEYGQLQGSKELFDSIMVIENYPLHARLNKEKGELSIDSYSMFEMTNYDLTVAISLSGGIEIDFTYYEDVLERAIIERLSRHFVNILENICEIPENELCEMDILPAGEKERILYIFNADEPGPTEIYSGTTLHRLFDRQAERTPHTAALIFKDRHVTYRELQKKSNRLTGRIRAAGKHPLVGILVDPGEYMITSLLGILKAGSAYLPIDPRYPRERIRYIMRDSNILLILTEEQYDGLTSCPGSIIVTSAETYAGPAVAPQDNAVPADPAYVIYTSGSTGNPKGVVITHLNAAAYIEAFERRFRFQPEDIVIQQASYAFDAFVEEMYPILLKGGRLVTPTRDEVIDSEKLATFIIRHCVTRITCSPLMLAQLNHLLRAGTSIKTFISGGDRLKYEHIDNLLKLGEVTNTYGPTETTVCVTYYTCRAEGPGKALSTIPIGKPIYGYSVYILDRWLNPVPIGINGELCVSGPGVGAGYLNKPELTAKRFVNNKLQITNYKQITNSKLQNTNSGFQITKKYEKDDDHTIQVIENKELSESRAVPHHSSFITHHSALLYKTGDLCRWLPDGNIEFKGRIDRQVKIRGFRIEPGEIESRLLEHKEVIEAVVIDRETDAGENYLCAYIVAKRKAQSAKQRSHDAEHPRRRIYEGEQSAEPVGANLVFARDPEHGAGRPASQPVVHDDNFPSLMREFLSRTLPDYMIPAYFVTLEKMPFNPNGKIDMKSLPGPWTAEKGRKYIGPRDKVEEKLVEIWRDVLGLHPGKELSKQPGIDDNFFESGGHSLKAARLTAYIHKEFDVEIPIGEIFNIPTIRGLSGYIGRASRRKYGKIEQAEKKEYYTLSSPQRRLYVLQQMDADNTVYNISGNIPVETVVPIAQQVEFERLQETFKKLIRRHESLRTAFYMLDEQPVQQVLNPEDTEFRVEYDDISADDVKKHKEIPFPGKASQGRGRLLNRFVRPFDLSRAPLLRVGLLKTADTTYRLLVDMHHIICDGVSQEILLRDFRALYEERSLSPLRVQYKDFSQWQSSARQQEVLRRQKTFWMENFSGEIPVLNLPTDFARPIVQSFAGGSEYFEIPEGRTAALRKLALDEGTSLFMVLAALVVVLLARLSGQEEVIIGTAASGRGHADLDNVIGMFVNTLALRNFPDCEKTFREFLSEVKQRSLAAFDNQEYPFEDLVEEVEINRDTGRNPLFDVMFAVNTISFASSEADGPEPVGSLYERSAIEQETTKFDLTLIADDASRCIFFTFQYCITLFRKETIHRFIAYFNRIIGHVIKDINKPIGDIEIIDADEKKQILEVFNHTDAAYPRHKTIYRLFAEQVEKNPHCIALMDTNRQHLSYEELAEQSSHLAYSLIGRGIQTGSIVGIMIERSIAMMVGIFAILKSGSAYLPISPHYPQERTAYILRDSGAAVLLTSRSLFEEVEKLRSLEVETMFIEDIGIRQEARGSREKQCRGESMYSPAIAQSAKSKEQSESCQELRCAPCALRSANSSKNLAYIIYTSGSTGRPKGVQIEHHSVINRLHWMQKCYPLTGSDVILQKTTFTFDVSVWELFWWSFQGAGLGLLGPGDEKDPQAIVEAVKDFAVTTMHFVPSMLISFLDYLDSAAGVLGNLKSLKQVFASGEALGVSQVNRFYRLFKGANNVKLVNLYGPTEATVDVSYFDCPAIGEMERVPIGKPIDNICLYVLDRGLHLQPIGITGQLYISGAGLARGYLNQPELTAEKFINYKLQIANDKQITNNKLQITNKHEKDDDHTIQLIKNKEASEIRAISHHSSFLTHHSALLYKTGDLARWLPDGNLEFLGRVDYQVKIRGFRIELEEIEKQLTLAESLPLKEALVTAVPDSCGDNRLIAYIVPDERIAFTLHRQLALRQGGLPAHTFLYEWPNGMPVCYLNRPETDFMYREIFSGRTYLRHGITLREGACIFDVGANIGVFSLFAHVNCKNARIYSYEPIPPVYQVLSMNTSLYQGDFKTFNFGIGARDEEAVFTYYPHAALLSGSFARPEQDAGIVKVFLRSREQEEGISPKDSAEQLSEAQYDELLAERLTGKPYTCQLRTLSREIEERGVETIDLLKIDVEKAELEVLKGIKEEHWPLIKQLVIEVHEGGILLDQVKELLETKGYRVAVDQEDLLQETSLYNLYAVRESSLTLNKKKHAAGELPPWRSLPGLVKQAKELLQSRLPDYMVPAHIVPLVRFPLTPNGKIDRKALPLPEVTTDEHYTAPRDEVELKLVEIWSELLGLEESKIGIDDNFFDLGGHSLKAVLLNSRIQNKLNADIKLADIFRMPTIRRLSAYIDSAAEEKFLSIKAAEQKDFYACSSVQKRLYILQQVKATNTAYNIPVVMILEEGDIKREKFALTFKKLIARHESLRTSFHVTAGEPVQRIHQPDEVEFEIEYYSAERRAQSAEQGAHDAESPRRSTDEDGQNAEPVGANLVFARDAIETFIRPFDLSHAPLLRVGLVTLPDGDITSNILMVDMHHIISDGASMEVFVREFMAIYSGEELAHRRIQYKDFSEWQNREKNKSIEGEKQYWLDLFKGETPVLDLPCDYFRPQVRSFAGDSIDYIIGREETKALKELAKEEGVTLFMVLLAIYNLWLSKLTCCEDIVVGVPIVGRRREELQHIIGMFVNTLALRNYPRREKTFREFLQETRESTLAAFDNQDVQFEDLVELIESGSGADRGPGRNPLFDVVFTYQNMDIPRLEFAGLRLTPYRYKNRTAKFDLTLIAAEQDEHFLCTFEYATDLFRKDTIERYAGYFRAVISAVLANRNIKAADVDILSKEEKERLLFFFNDTAIEYPREKTIHDLFAEQSARTPHHIALIGQELDTGCADSRHGVSLSYLLLRRKVEQFAILLENKGVHPGTLVGIMVRRSIEMIIGILGILKAGGAYLPIDPEYPEQRIKYMLSESRTRLLLTTRNLTRQVEKICDLEVETIFIEDIGIRQEARGSREKQWRDESMYSPVSQPLNFSTSQFLSSSRALAYVIYTSGTTGKPKGSLTTHTNVVRVVRNTNYIRLTTDDRLLQLSNYAFDGSVFDIYGALLNGSTLVLIEREKVLAVDQLAALIRKEQITVFFLTTALFNTLVDLQLDCLKNVRKILFGGERVSLEHTTKALKHLGKGRVIHVYGPTETTVYATYYPVTQVDETAITIPIGKPIANTTTYVLDKNRRLLPLGIAGEIYIGGAGVARGYLNSPELTAEKFINEKRIAHSAKRKARSNELKENSAKQELWSTTPCAVRSAPCDSPRSGAKLYRTGDLARWLPDGNIEFLGRTDTQVKLRGFRVELEEIERQLLKYEEIKETVVMVRKDDTGDKYLCAYLVAESSNLDASEVRRYLSQTLPAYMIPSYFMFLEKMPLNPNGKVDRKALPHPGSGEQEGEHTAPRDRLEEQLVKIWSEVLGVNKKGIGIDDSFFGLGGHSLKATLLVGKIYKELNVQLPLSEVFKITTIRGLSQRIKELNKEKYATIEPTEKREYYPATAAQQRFFFMQQLTPGTTIFNMPDFFTLDKNITDSQIEQAFRKIINRHESLRASFHLEGGKVVQWIHAPGEIEFKIEYYDAERIAHSAKQKSHRKNLESQSVGANLVFARIPTEIFIRPFDLSRAPLLRVGQITGSSGKSIFMVDLHHIISDGSSQQVLARDFVTLLSGKELPPPRLQYRDFARWQARLLHSGRVKQDEEYWMNRFSGELPVLHMPTDFPRPLERDYAGEQFSVTLDRELSRQVKRLTLETGASLFMVFLTALNILLYRYTGQEDIIIGTVTAGRNHADLEHTIGLLLGTLLLRNFPKGEKSFTEFLEEVKESTLAAYKHQDYPFEELLKILDYKEAPNRNPITDIALIGQNVQASAEARELQDITASVDSLHAGESKMDLTINVLEQREHIVLVLEYSTALFRRSTMERLVEHLEKILREAVINSTVPLSRLDMVSSEEKLEMIGRDVPCYPLTHAQKRIFYTDKRYPGTPVNNLAFTLRYGKVLDKELLQQAVNLVIERNEGLRLRMVEFDLHGEPMQYAVPPEVVSLDEVDFSSSGSEEQAARWIAGQTQKPFDLLNRGLFYFAYLKFNEKESGYYAKLHHIIADGWTTVLLFHQVDETYESLKTGQGVSDMANPSYLEYIREEEDYLNSAQARKDKEFWFRYLLPLPEKVVLGTPGKGDVGIESRSELLPFPDDLRSKIHRYCKDNKTTIFKLVLSALSIYIWRVTGTVEAVIATAGHNRSGAGQKKTAGMFVSTIPLRIKIDDQAGFARFATTTGEDVNFILKNHQSYPFDRLAVELKEETGIDPGYLLDIDLVGHPDIEQEKFKIEYSLPRIESNPLTIHINVNNRDLRGLLELEWKYQTRLFSPQDINRIHNALLNILSETLAHPDRKLRDIELLSPPEKESILYTFNAENLADTGAAGVSTREATLHRLFEHQAERTPLSTALIFRDRQVTYSCLQDRSNRLAGRIRAAGKHLIVGILLDPAEYMIAGLLGILKAGGAYLPIDPRYPRERIDYIIRDSNISLLLTEGKYIKQDTCPGSILAEAAETYAGPEPAPADTAVPGDPAYVIYTSGSTGNPKGVVITHRNAAAYIEAFQRRFNFQPEDTVIQQASYAFDAFVEEIYPILLKGGKLAVPDRAEVIDVEKLTAFIDRHCVTRITCSPQMLGQLNSRLRTGTSIKTFISGGDRLKHKHIDKLLELGDVFNTYGPTETTVCVTYYKCPPKKPGEAVSSIPIGRPIYGYSVYILDRCLKPVPIGINGELCVAGLGVGAGYLNNSELTAEKFASGGQKPFCKKVSGLPKTFVKAPLVAEGRKLYKTGDLCRWLPDGNIEFSGRIDHQVKIRGFRVELGEIERQLLNHEEIKETVVMVRKDDAGDKYLCAYLVTKRKAQSAEPVGENLKFARDAVPSDLDTSELRRFLSRTLSGYMIPSYFVQLEKLPLNPAGKLDRRALPAPEFNAGEDYTAPRDEVEVKLAGIWSEVLGIDKDIISIDADFFKSGGHSLRATNLAAKIYRELNIKVPLDQLFKTPTIRRLSSYIKRAEQEKYAAIAPAEKKEYFILSSAQRRLYMLQQLKPGSTLYNMPISVILEGELHREKLEEVFRKLITRHGSFRTSFIIVEGEVVQKIHEPFDVEFEIEYYSAQRKAQPEAATKPTPPLRDTPPVEGNPVFARDAFARFIRTFDLTCAPLLRVGLINQDEEKNILMIDTHHIISDGTSHGIFIEDFMALYQRKELPCLSTRYSDYSEWQNSDTVRETLKLQEVYWLKEFSGEIPVLNLPADFERPDIQSFEGRSITFKINNEESRVLKQVAFEEGTSLFSLLLAIFNVFISKITGQYDILIGTQIAGRRHTELQNTIGVFLNTLVLRNYLHPDKSFTTLLRETTERTLKAFENQDYLFEDLVEKVIGKREINRNPLFDVMFVWQNMEMKKVRIPGLTLKPLQEEPDKSRALIDLSLYGQEEEENVMFILEYNTSLFKKETIERFITYFKGIISVIAANRDIKPEDIKISHDLGIAKPGVSLESEDDFGF